MKTRRRRRFGLESPVLVQVVKIGHANAQIASVKPLVHTIGVIARLRYTGHDQAYGCSLSLLGRLEMRAIASACHLVYKV
jgi:hypothetical protein